MLSKKHLSLDLDSSQFYIIKARQSISEKLFPLFAVECGLLEAHIAYEKGDRELYRKILENQLQLLETVDLPHLKSRVLMFIGIDDTDERQYESAEKVLKEALLISESISDSSMISSIHYSLATIYEINNQLEKAIEFYQKTMDIDQSIGREINKAATLLNLSIIYEKLNDFDQSEKCLLEAISLNNKFNRPQANYYTFTNMGTLLMEKGRFREAIQYLTKADSVVIALNYTDAEKMHTIYINLAEAHYNLQEYDKSIKFANKILIDASINDINILAKRMLAKVNAKQGNCIAAVQYLDSVKDTNVEQLLPDEIVKHYYATAEIYQLCNNYKKAYEYLNLAYEKRDSIYIKTDKQNAIEAEAKYQASVKERENEKLKFDNNLQLAQIQTQNAYIWGGSISLLVLGLMLMFLYRLNKKRKTLNIALAESNKRIKLLHRESLHRNQNQLALATTLISLQKSQAANKDPMEIIRDSESKLRAIAAVNKKLSTQDEEQVAKLSEVVEEIVSGNIFSMAPFKIELQTEIDDILMTPERVSVLSLLTNELSVNSIKHAFGNTADPIIHINFHQQNGSYIYNYRDNGQVAEVQKEGSGTQLINGLINQLNGMHSVEMKPSYQLRIEIPVV